MTEPILDTEGLKRARRLKAAGFEPVKPFIWRGTRSNTARDSRGALFKLDGANGWIPMVGVDAATNGVLLAGLRERCGDPTICVRMRRTNDENGPVMWWFCGRCKDFAVVDVVLEEGDYVDTRYAGGPTEADALIEAWEAQPARAQ